MSVIEFDKERALRCRANDCPNNWSVSREGHPPLCQHHAWAPMWEWPRITQQLIDRLAYTEDVPPTIAPHVTVADRSAILKRLRAVMVEKMDADKDPKAWARRLRDKHASGEKLNLNQIRCYRNALGIFESDESWP